MHTLIISANDLICCPILSLLDASIRPPAPAADKYDQNRHDTTDRGDENDNDKSNEHTHHAKEVEAGF